MAKKGKNVVPKRAGKSAASVPNRASRNVKSVLNVYEEPDDEATLNRKGHKLDDLEDLQYNQGEINEEDDEEINSDDAFDEEDEEKYEHFKFLGSKTSSKQRKAGKKDALDMLDEDSDEIQENQNGSEDNEDENESEEEDGEDYVDLSEMLNDQPSEAKVKSTSKKVTFATSDDEGSDEEMSDASDGSRPDSAAESDVASDDEAMLQPSDEEDVEDESKLEALDSSIAALGAKRKSSEDDEANSKRRRLPERTEAYTESEYNLPNQRYGSESVSSNKLSLDTMMSAIQSETGLGNFKAAMQKLDIGGADKKVSETLAAPLPKRIQDRLNRIAAYDETKKGITKWQPIVKKNREAEHLAFPLNEEALPKGTNASLVSTFKAETDLEKDVSGALEEAGLKEKDLQQYEELALNKLSVEEVEARRKELRLMRDLMFRDEIKAKRMAKIKSKAYRRIKKKEKLKNSMSLEQLEEHDPALASEERLKMEQARAMERMSLRHKNTGKWAKQMLRHGQQDEGTRQAIMEQLERGEQLRRKIQGIEGSEDEDEASEDNTDNEGVDGEEGARAKALEELDKLEEDMRNPDPKPSVGKGIFAMKFMQEAAKRQEAESQQLLDQMREEFENGDLTDDDDGTKSAELSKAGNHRLVQNNPGRMAFGANPTVNQNENTRSLNDTQIPKINPANTKSSTSSSNKAHLSFTQEKPVVQTPSETKRSAFSEDNESNPWLSTEANLSLTRRRANRDRHDNTKAEKLVSKLSKNKKQAKADDDLEINVETTMTMEKSTEKHPKKISSSAVSQNNDQSAESDSDSDDKVNIPQMVHTKSALAISQRDLVAQAFANDNVVEDFEAEKRMITEEDAPKEVDLTLPGWGSWGGKGVKKNQKKKIIQKPKPSEGVEANKRRDAKLQHVIINEKKNKKASKYQVTQVPHIFESGAQYEDYIRAPIGKEWNTTAAYQKNVLPRVTTKLGRIIDPLTAPFKS
ncbi:hypothetical protein BZG36_03176 [Bifiguratus adelaidae]|uniref:Uncharacterized protein n=1 Tax=Bifiguratus adelaidae TaxID=1938954 RepID=A0A261XYX1_9FUNG|nr:hypothetical protein BZG36_03176 [Bifiguratus adelaidae]